MTTTTTITGTATYTDEGHLSVITADGSHLGFGDVDQDPETGEWRDLVDAKLAAGGWVRTGDWDGDDAPVAALIGPATVTATANVVDGYIEFDLSALDEDGPASTAVQSILCDPSSSGMLIGRIDVGPWGEEEESMERADKALAEYGLRRVTEWDDTGITVYPHAQVTR